MSTFTTRLRVLTQQGEANRYVIWAVLGLSAIGALAVSSTTEALLNNHLLRVGVAVSAAALFSVIDYRWLARWSKVLLVGTFVLLVVVKLMGAQEGGATRWLRVAGVGFQPSDLAKVALVLYIAVLLARKQAYIQSFTRAFLPVGLWLMATVVLIGLEDLSTALVLLVAVTLMCFVARVSVLQLMGTGLVALVLAVALLSTSPQRAARVESFVGMKLFPHTTEAVFDEQGEGYQARQARIALAMGGLFGRGMGQSVQRDFLPEPSNDFIFAIIGEEYGFLGVVVVLGLFGLFLFQGFLRIARAAPDPLGLFMATGLTTVIVLFGLVHAGVSAGLFPVTGLALPFVSYGGTSLLANGVMVGILLNISRQARPLAEATS
ncbi:MAG: FtsW/RodA/SpoVE family cell cycle protein [Bacteroidota bacterium]